MRVKRDPDVERFLNIRKSASPTNIQAYERLRSHSGGGPGYDNPYDPRQDMGKYLEIARHSS